MPSAGDDINVDDFTGQLDDNTDRISALETLTAPFDARLDSLETLLLAFLGNVRAGAVVDTVGGDARVHLEFAEPFEEGEIPKVVVSYGDFTLVHLMTPYVIEASIDENGFDVAVFYALDNVDPAWVAGDPATGESVRINYVAITPSNIS